MGLARYAWVCCSASGGVWAIVVAVFVLQLTGKLPWDGTEKLWLAMGLAPFGLLAGYWLVGEPLRGFGAAAATLVLMGGAFGLGMLMLTEDAGPILTGFLAVACTLSLGLAGWCGYDTYHRGVAAQAGR